MLTRIRDLFRIHPAMTGYYVGVLVAVALFVLADLDRRAAERDEGDSGEEDQAEDDAASGPANYAGRPVPLHIIIASGVHPTTAEGTGAAHE